MRAHGIAAIALAAVLLAATPAAAGSIRVLGIDTTSFWDHSVVPYLTGVDFTEASISEFATEDFSNYDVLYFSEMFLNRGVTDPAQAALDAINARASDIQSFLSAGGGVLALSQPIGTGRWDWLPDSVEPTEGAHIHDDSVRIVDATHPVMKDLTDAGLSNWVRASHGNFITTADLTTLVDDGGTRAITLVGRYGSGRLVITDQDPDYHNDVDGVRKPDQIQFVQNSIEWLATVPLPSAVWAGLVLLAGLGAGRRLRRRSDRSV